MQTYQEFHTLNEALITFGKGGGKPKFGHIVFLAGGAAAGKGLVTSHMLGIEGKVLNVDNIKDYFIKSAKLRAQVKSEYGIDISPEAFPLSNPRNTGMLHSIIAADKHIPKHADITLFKSIATADEERKPNLIIDTTMQNTVKISNITYAAIEAGYQKENIHMVWVCAPYHLSKELNLDRGEQGGRSVDDDVLWGTHHGAATTLKAFIYGEVNRYVKPLSKYMDGDMWIVFNQPNIDMTLTTSEPKPNTVFPSRKLSGGAFIAKGVNYIKIKSQGSPVEKPNQDLVDKIASYVPYDRNGGWKKMATRPRREYHELK